MHETLSTNPSNARSVLFWIGAFATLVWSITLYVLASLNNGGFPHWIQMITIGGTVAAFYLAWTVLQSWPERGLAVAIFIGSALLSIFAGLALPYLIGFIGLTLGAPRGESRQSVHL